MAYTNGIFRINLQTGSDTARTALTSCTASNPSGSVTRINKTAHGLVTGAVVDLTLFSTWLNEAWKITVVDADNFDLDGAVWQTTADTSGTVTPRGGSSWSDAWLTFASGATAARIQPGDQIRVGETPVTSASVDATFTNGSRTVTLATALTKTIQNVTTSGDWTESSNITKSTNSNRKIGSNALVFTPAAAFTTGKVAYSLVAGGGTQDYSAYSKITLWYRSTGSSIGLNTYRICLCSDTTGDTIVNSLTIDKAASNSTWHSITIDYGGALSSSIQSVALYANSDPGTTGFSINNIMACNDVSLDSIIGPESDCMYGIQSIDGTTLSIDSSTTNISGQGWSGTTGTVAMYFVTPIIQDASNTLQEAGSTSQYIEYIGGYNSGSDTRTGRTFIQSRFFSLTAFSTQSSVSIKNIGIFRFSSFMSTTDRLLLDNVIYGNTSGFFGYGSLCEFRNCFFLNSSHNTNAVTDSNGPPTTFYNCVFANATAGLSLSSQGRFIKCIFRNNSTASVLIQTGTSGPGLPDPVFYKCLFLDTTEFTYPTVAHASVRSYEHDQTAGNNWIFSKDVTVNWQTVEKQGSDPGAWKVIHSGTTRTELTPMRIKVAEVAVSASSLVTVAVWVKKDHATNVGCKVFVEDADYTLSGVVSDSETAASSTAWQQLTISFTPTSAGIVPIWFDSFYISGNSNTYFGSITVTQ